MGLCRVWILLVPLLMCGPSSNSLSIATLEELEKLLEEYRRTATVPLDSPQASNSAAQQNEGIPKVLPNAAACSSSCRVAYGACLTRFQRLEDKQTCADLFVMCFPKCFYGDEVVGHPDISICQPLCLKQYDTCVDYSVNKAEIFVCRIGRHTCDSKCSALDMEKRGVLNACKTGCTGSWDLCWRSINDNMQEMFICKAARNACDKECDRRSGDAKS